MNRKSLMSSGLDYGPTDVTRINDKPRNPEIDHLSRKIFYSVEEWQIIRKYLNQEIR